MERRCLRQLATGCLTWTIPAADQPRLLQAITRVPGPAALSDFAAPTGRLGAVRYGGGGAQGVSPAPGALLPVTVPNTLPGPAVQLTATTRGGAGQLDAVLLTPLLAVLITASDGHSVALVNSEADTQRTRTVQLPGTGRTSPPATTITPAVAGHHQHRRDRHRAGAPGGFAVVQR
jgi:hypothetical protein